MATFDEFIRSIRTEFGEQAAGKKFEVFCKWFGLVPLRFRSLNSFMRPFVQMPRGFYHPAMSDGGAGYKSH